VEKDYYRAPDLPDMHLISSVRCHEATRCVAQSVRRIVRFKNRALALMKNRRARTCSPGSADMDEIDDVFGGDRGPTVEANRPTSSALQYMVEHILSARIPIETVLLALTGRPKDGGAPPYSRPNAPPSRGAPHGEIVLVVDTSLT